MKIKSDIITSRSNPIVKQIAALTEKKWRDRLEFFIAEGEKLTFEALKSGLPVAQIVISESKWGLSDTILERAKYNELYEKCELIQVSDSVFEKISTEKAPQGVISVIKHLDFFRKMDIIYKEEFFLKPEERALSLCSVRDPGNLGAIIRSAAAFGVEHIVMSDDCADIYNPKTIRSAMGSVFSIRVTKVSKMDAFVKCAIENNRRVFAAELRDGAVSISDIDIKKSDIFMIGNEGHGIPEELSKQTTGSVYIPISSVTESLNASVAAAVFMWEQNK